MLPRRILPAPREKSVSARMTSADHRSVGSSSHGFGPARALIAGMLAGFIVIWPFSSQAALAGEADSSMVAIPKAPLDLDGLFAKLKDAPNAESALITSKAIQQRWAHSGSDTADLLMQRADAALASNDRPLAIEILDRLIVLDPDWAEAWNRRATVFFLEDDLSRSAADIQEVLAREPRHFGALMGLGGILERIGDDRKALEAYERVLEVYPLLPSAQKAVERLKTHFKEVPI